MNLSRALRNLGSAALRPFPSSYRFLDRFERLDPALWRFRRFAARHPELAFVQIGSNDGVAGDPVRPHVAARGWRGLCVEPLPAMFARLQQNYAGVAGMSFANVAVGEADGVAALYTVAGSHPDDPPWIERVSSFDRAHLDRHAHAIPDFEQRLVTEEVPVRTYARLVEEVGIAPDVVHIDAEGADEGIVRQVLSHEPLPVALLYEHAHIPPARRRTVEQALERAGYSFTTGIMDTFAVRRRASDELRTPGHDA